ncbi:MAG TPA: hypothetical protein PKW90_07465, partial [Myxococcota bacterium]|nr:hypothetical protein [Myxococcota bacterium]
PTNMYAIQRVSLSKWSGLSITIVLLCTCGLGAFYLCYIQYRALKQLNPEAMDPALAILLDLLGWIFTAGLLSLVIQYLQTRHIVALGERSGESRRNNSLLRVVMVAHVVSLLSIWLSWTGFLAVVAAAGSIYSLRQIQKELELYTEG